jgi:hypothetical protein
LNIKLILSEKNLTRKRNRGDLDGRSDRRKFQGKMTPPFSGAFLEGRKSGERMAPEADFLLVDA